MTSSQGTWLLALMVSVIATILSTLAAVLSLLDDEMLQAALSTISAVLFLFCVLLILRIRTNLKAALETPDEVDCLRLKKAGIERSEEIVPKGKMPKE